MENGFLIAQIFGLIAMCFSLTAWQLKSQKHILMCYVPSSFFWCLQYSLLGAYNAALFSFICMFKDAALSQSSAKALKYIVGAFIIFNIGILFVFYKSPFDLLPMMVCLFVNIPLLKKDNRYWMARGNIAAQLCWIVFNINAGAWMGVLCAIFVISSAITGMIRHENWVIGRCRRTFIPSIARSLFVFPSWRTYP